MMPCYCARLPCSQSRTSRNYVFRKCSLVLCPHSQPARQKIYIHPLIHTYIHTAFISFRRALISHKRSTYISHLLRPYFARSSHKIFIHVTCLARIPDYRLHCVTPVCIRGIYRMRHAAVATIGNVAAVVADTVLQRIPNANSSAAAVFFVLEFPPHCSINCEQLLDESTHVKLHNFRQTKCIS